MKLNLLPRREPAGERHVVAGAEPIRHLILATVALGLSVPVPTLAAGDRAGTSTGREGQPVRSLLEMRRDKVVMQDWDLSCGAAALATLLAYQHGDSVPEREVAKGMIRREEYLTDPSRVQKGGGFSLLDLKRYVDRRGYEGVGYGQLDFEYLIELAPIIVPLSLTAMTTSSCSAASGATACCSPTPPGATGSCLSKGSRTLGWTFPNSAR